MLIEKKKKNVFGNRNLVRRSNRRSTTVRLTLKQIWYKNYLNMAIANYTLPFGGLGGQSWSATISPIQQHATAVNNLLYGPAGHQETDLEPDGTNDEYYKNNPYATPSHRVTQQNYRRNNNEYLPPVPIQYNTQSTRSQTRSQYQTQTTKPRTYGEGSYSNVPQRTAQPPNTQYFNNYNNQRVTYSQTPTATPQPNTRAGSSSVSAPSYPQQAPGFTKVNAGQGSRTQVHAVLDYDGDENDYYDDHGSDGHAQGRNLFLYFIFV